MTSTLSDKARAGRRAALETLRTRLAFGTKVVSIFEDSPPRRESLWQFHTVRRQPGAPQVRRPDLVVQNPAAA